MDPHNAMEFEWDGAKSDRCITNRGFGFSYAIRAFRMTTGSSAGTTAETTTKTATGCSGRVFVVIYTMRGSTMRIISARKANGREVREYERNTHQD